MEEAPRKRSSITATARPMFFAMKTLKIPFPGTVRFSSKFAPPPSIPWMRGWCEEALAS